MSDAILRFSIKEIGSPTPPSPSAVLTPGQLLGMAPTWAYETSWRAAIAALFELDRLSIGTRYCHIVDQHFRFPAGALDYLLRRVAFVHARTRCGLPSRPLLVSWYLEHCICRAVDAYRRAMERPRLVTRERTRR